MSLQCILCGHEENSVSLVEHINKAHSKGGLATYQMFFPEAKVVSRDLFTTIRKSVYQGLEDNSIPELNTISHNDRLTIVQTAESQAPQRSEIIVTEE